MYVKNCYMQNVELDGLLPYRVNDKLVTVITTLEDIIRHLIEDNILDYICHEDDHSEIKGEHGCDV